jgi:hypothetical protein
MFAELKAWDIVYISLVIVLVIFFGISLKRMFR